MLTFIYVFGALIKNLSRSFDLMYVLTNLIFSRKPFSGNRDSLEEDG